MGEVARIELDISA